MQVIDVRGVAYSYGAQDGSPAISGIDLTVEPGQCVVVCGRNGSGKSTLARMLNGLILPDSGHVLINGMDSADMEHTWEIRRRVGFVQQNPENQIVGALVEEDVAFGPENLGVPREEMRERVASAIETVGLAGLERREPHLLSGGQKQRLAIAGALAMQPDYLVLDEPTAMLDPSGREGVLLTLSRLRERGVGILHVTHHVADVSEADVVIVLDEGAVAFRGSAEELLGAPSLLTELGLTVPPLTSLVSELRGRGAAIPSVVHDPRRVVDALWRLS